MFEMSVLPYNMMILYEEIDPTFIDYARIFPL